MFNNGVETHLSALVWKSRDLLQRAGASSTALARFERQWNQLWPEDAADFEEYLRRQSPADLAAYIEKLSLPSPDDHYLPGADYLLQPDVPKGEVFEFTLTQSLIFPGTHRRIRVY